MIEQGESSEKEIQTSYEAVRGQIVVGEGELESKEGVRRIVKKYQGRISEMLRLIQKQKRQNESLKAEFKHLNEQLNSVLKKVQQPKNEDSRPPERPEVTRKELENELKKNALLRKELEQLKYRLQYLNAEQLDTLKNQLKEKDRSIEELKARIRLFQKLDKQEKQGDSYRKEQELTHKIMQLNQEILHLKKKSQEQRRREQELEKTIKTCREQVTLLQAKPKAPPEDKKEKPEVSGGEVEKLKQKCKQLESLKRAGEKNSRQEIEGLQLKLKSMDRQLTECREELARKDKEGSIMLFRLKEKERKNFSTLEPIKTARYSQEVLHNSTGGLFETRKEFRGLSWGQGVYREFDDSQKLPTEKNYRIQRLVFTFFEEHILSLTTEYTLLEGEPGKDLRKSTKLLESFSIPSQYSNIKTAEYVFGDYEYINSLEVFCGRGIEFLRIATSKQHLLEVGNPRSLPRCKQYSFEISPHEKPIAWLGVTEHRRINGESREFLVNLGMELRRKQVFAGGRTRRAESSLNRSLLARSHNDKNS